MWAFRDIAAVGLDAYIGQAKYRTLLFALSLVATPALAQPEPPAGGNRAEDRNSLTLGIGGGIAPEYEGASDYGFQPGGIIQGKVDGFDFQVRGPNIFIDLIRDAPGSKLNLIAGPVAQIRSDRTSISDIKDPRGALLGTRDTAVELGGYIGVGIKGVLIPPASLTFDLAFVYDVAGAHESFILTPGIALSSPVSQRTFARLGVSAAAMAGRILMSPQLRHPAHCPLTPPTAQGSKASAARYSSPTIWAAITAKAGAYVAYPTNAMLD